LKSFALPTVLIAPCGMNCSLCMAYIREKNSCPGCREDDKYKAKSCVNCQIKNCAKIVKGDLKYCFKCDTFPCERLKHLDKRYRTKYSMSMIENLNLIKNRGIRRFVENEKKRWACPQCSRLLCVHRSECTHCHYVWR